MRRGLVAEIAAPRPHPRPARPPGGPARPGRRALCRHRPGDRLGPGAGRRLQPARPRAAANRARRADVDAVNPRALLRHAATVLHEALDVVDRGLARAARRRRERRRARRRLQRHHQVRAQPRLARRRPAGRGHRGARRPARRCCSTTTPTSPRWPSCADAGATASRRASLVYLTGTYGICAGHHHWRRAVARRARPGRGGRPPHRRGRRTQVRVRAARLPRDPRRTLRDHRRLPGEREHRAPRRARRRSGSARASTRSPRSPQSGDQGVIEALAEAGAGSAAAPPWCARSSTRAPSSSAATTRGWRPGCWPPPGSPSAVALLMPATETSSSKCPYSVLGPGRGRSARGTAVYRRRRPGSPELNGGIYFVSGFDEKD